MKKVTEPLAKHTWLKIGGIAEIAIPSNKEEFVNLLEECHQSDRSYRILGNGSNLLVCEDIDDLIIKTTDACTNIEFNGSFVHAGASIRVPQFVNECSEHGLGGYEYLYSVPGTIGGAIYMNAGRGAKHNKTISDHLVSVEIFDGTTIRTIPSSKLNFKHRFSTFQERPKWTILSARFNLQPKSNKQIKTETQKRMAKVADRERQKPNAGSVFKSGSLLPLHKVPPNGLRVGDARFVESNRICNDGNATFQDVKRLILFGKFLNQLAQPFGDVEVEYVIWE